MILLFGEKAHKTTKNSNIKNHPVENSGILAMNRYNNVNSLLDANEYDIYMFSQQANIDYSMYAQDVNNTNVAFMSGFSEAVSVLGEASSSSSSFGGFGGECSSSCSCSCSSGSFSSVC